MLENLAQFKPPSNCPVSLTILEFDTIDSHLLEAYLSDIDNWSSSDLSIALSSVGVALGEPAITLHREEKCKCYWKPTVFGDTHIIDTPSQGEYEASDASPGAIKLTRSRITTSPATQYNTSVEELIKAGYLLKGEKLFSLAAKYPGKAVINEDGQILFNGNIYNSLSTSAIKCKQGHNPSATTENGWSFWSVLRDGELISIKQIRDDHMDLTQGYGIQGIQDMTLDKKEVVSYLDLLEAELLIEGSILYSLDWSKNIYVKDNTLVSEDGTLFHSLKEAAKFMEHGDINSDKYMNGWKYWHYLRGNILVPLSKLRDELLA
jgi:hypothetical protein